MSDHPGGHDLQTFEVPVYGPEPTQRGTRDEITWRALQSFGMSTATPSVRPRSYILTADCRRSSHSCPRGPSA